MEEQVSKKHFMWVVNELQDALLQAQTLFAAQIKEQGEDQTNITVMSEIGLEICGRALETQIFPRSLSATTFQMEQQQ